jgi:hypothetical protein
VIDGTAHLPNLERPEEFNRLVLDFFEWGSLRRLRRDPASRANR